MVGGFYPRCDMDFGLGIWRDADMLFRRSVDRRPPEGKQNKNRPLIPHCFYPSLCRAGRRQHAGLEEFAERNVWHG